MTALTMKERASVNAALATIHASGRDVRPIQQQARTAMSQGKPPYAAYKAALGAFVKASPDLAPVLRHTDRLIEASDSRTVGRYDKALSAYIATGDEAHVNALEGMFRADSVALAVKSGELSGEDVAAGRVDWGAMGLADPAPAASAPQRFSFGDPPPAQPGAAQAAPAGQAPARPAAPATDGGRHWGFTGGGTGVRSAKAEARFSAFPHPVTSRPSPYAGMAPTQIKEAMRADAAAPRGWVDRPSDGQGQSA